MNHPKKSLYGFGTTRWSLISAAKRTCPDGQQARFALLERYQEAAERFLLSFLKDSHAADEVFSRLVARMCEKPKILKNVDSSKGKFRHYLVRTLKFMAIDYLREQSMAPEAYPTSEVAAPPSGPDPDDESFRVAWTEDLMKHAWQTLNDQAEAKGHLHHRVLLYKSKYPKLSSQQIAEVSVEEFGKPLSAENVRQLLHRGQAALSDCVIAEVAKSLQEEQGDIATADDIEAELIELQFLDKPRKAALERYRANLATAW